MKADGWKAGLAAGPGPASLTHGLSSVAQVPYSPLLASLSSFVNRDINNCISILKVTGRTVERGEKGSRGHSVLPFYWFS